MEQGACLSVAIGIAHAHVHHSRTMTMMHELVRVQMDPSLHITVRINDCSKLAVQNASLACSKGNTTRPLDSIRSNDGFYGFLPTSRAAVCTGSAHQQLLLVREGSAWSLRSFTEVRHRMHPITPCMRSPM